ncbi:hypothetical protein BLNAU_21715 [Blattamonas nauphoetae]|uniref:Uncharacterized protein n=1 Tax=Blattamonas nauphoetae TaxID=2049346 RepID=A0ABQ9WV25_9EUKA|nr:hypothetical protein BLNAU_21715 [Blattamonas nauphoetae]
MCLIQSVLELVYSPNQNLNAAALKTLVFLLDRGPFKHYHSLVKSDLIKNPMKIFNPVSPSLNDCDPVHLHLTEILVNSLTLQQEGTLIELNMDGTNAKAAVFEMGLISVLLEISLSYQPTMNFVHDLPVALPIQGQSIVARGSQKDRQQFPHLEYKDGFIHT